MEDYFHQAISQVQCALDAEDDIKPEDDIEKSSYAARSTGWMSPYSPSPEQVWSSWFGEFGSPKSASQAPSFHFSPIQTTKYLDNDGFLVPTAKISPGFDFSTDRVQQLSTEVNGAHRSLANSVAAIYLSVFCGLLSTLFCRNSNKTNLTMVLSIAVVAFLSIHIPQAKGQNAAVVLIAGLFPLTGPDAQDGAQQVSITRIAMELANSSPNLNSTSVALVSLDTESTETGGVKATNELGIVSLVMSSQSALVAHVVTPVIESLLVPHFTLSSSEDLTGKDWKLTAQMVPPDRFQGLALADVVEHFNWGRTVGVVSTSDVYGSAILRMFERRAKTLGWAPLATQEFVSGKQDIWLEMQSLKDSEARVIMSFMSAEDMKTVLRHADRLRMIKTNQYVWMCSDACASETLFTDQYGTVDEEMRERAVGMLGTRLQGAKGPQFEAFLDNWEQRDPLIYPGAGSRKMSFMAPFAYDMTLFAIQNIFSLLSVPEPNLKKFREFVVNSTLDGLTGKTVMDLKAQYRMPSYDIVNLMSLPKNYESIAYSQDYQVVGSWDILRNTKGLAIRDDYETDYIEVNKKNLLEWEKSIVWGGSTVSVPNLDVRNPIKYWSCEDHKMLVDETGRSIRLDPPNGDNGNIADYYRCDNYIDCYNMSDEWGCTVSFPVVFIVYGIAQGLLFLFAVFCLVFTCVFGCCFKRRRVRAASPTFLIIMVLACMLGYVGLFSFFGQPQSVACGFRIWIVCVSIVLMIAALFTKSFRIWRLYRSPTEIKAMKDWKLVVLVAILVLPVFILLALWTGLSTPTADLRNESDGHEHKMCKPGGVAHEAGGYTFFALIVAYIGILLLFGAFLSFVTRNVASTFNESRLIAISIFNLVFLGIVVIPIYFVLLNSGPVVLWVIIVTAVLYGLSATLVLQFVPKIYGVLIRDRLGDGSKSSFTTHGNETETAAESAANADSKAIW